MQLSPLPLDCRDTFRSSPDIALAQDLPIPALTSKWGGSC